MTGAGDARLLRAGAAAGVAAAAVAVGVNAFHPRPAPGALGDTAGHLRVVAASDAWRAVHLGSILATLLGVAAIAAVLWAAAIAGSRRWPAVALVAVAVTTPTLLVSIGIDGFALKAVADRWAAADGPERADLLAAAAALRAADLAVLDVVMVGQFGLTAVLCGVATWSSPIYGPRLGAVAVAGGVLGVASGTLQAVSGRLTTLSYLVLLSASLATFTAWLAAASVLLWRRAAAASPPAPPPATPARR